MASTAQATTSEHSRPIPPPILPQIAPSTYLQSHLTSASSSPIRPCGRSPSQTRPIHLNVGSLNNANGSALVRVGNTSVVAGVRAEILDVRNIPNYRPEQGIKRKRNDAEDEDDTEIHRHSLLLPNIELQTGASPLPIYQPSSGAPSSYAQSLTQRLLSTLHTTHLIRPSHLAIYGPHSPSDSDDSDDADPVLKGYWTLYIDILILSHDGSLFDVSLMAMMAALHNTTLPKAWFDLDRDQIICSPRLSDSHPLLSTDGVSWPVSLSWRIFSSSTAEKYILLDPDSLEEDSGACPEHGTIVITKGKGETETETEILKVEKNGGSALGKEDLREVLGMAEERLGEWRKALEESSSSSSSS